MLSTKYKSTPYRPVPFKFPNYTIIFHRRLQLGWHISHDIGFLTLTNTNCYGGINSTQSPDSSAGNVSEPGLISKVGRVREFVCT